MTTGLLLIVFAGLMNGSFATPLKRVRGWEWEHSWLVWSFTGLIVIPLITAAATVAHPLDVYSAAPAGTVALVALLGLLWGVASVLFGLGVSRVGLAIGFGLIIGISSILGTLIPLVTLHRDALLSRAGVQTIAGVLLLVAGVVCCGVAGRSREKSAAISKAGLAICILSGLGAPMINFGLAFGSGIVAAAERAGTPPQHSLNAVWPLLLGGAFFVNAGYCVFLMRRRSGFKVFGKPRAASNLGLSSLMGVLWMGSNLAYGYGSTAMGPLGLALGWPIMMACVVLTANGWSVATGEWKGAPPRAKRWMAAGVAALIAGVVVIGGAAGKID